MVSKKTGVLVIATILLLSIISISLASATLVIKKEAVSAMAIPSLDKPAIYDLTITNNGDPDVFSIYSIALVDILPNQSFALSTGETKVVRITAKPRLDVKISPNYYSFEYKIKGASTSVQTDDLAMTIVELKDAFDFYIEDINPASEKAAIHIVNKGGQVFDKLSLDTTSLFFTGTSEFSLAAFEDKTLEVSLDKNKVRSLLSGQYVVNAKITIDTMTAPLSTIMNFKEKEGILVSESSSGTIINKHTIEKKNEGNTKVDVTIVFTKNLISGLFTSFNVDPNKKEINGFTMNYVFTNQLSPGQALKVTATTNWWILVAIIIAVIAIWYLIEEYLRNKLVLNKKVYFVRTKGGEFALKVNITVKARDFVERIRVMDRIPPMVKIFEKYGTAGPEKIDALNRRLEWNIQALSAGEERVLSYIIYSKIGVVGKFELPAVEAFYEFKGKIKEAESNRAIYDNETKSSD